ncbi:2TM domain-containing protein [Ramlibacter sp. MMS24-I3-19]|uniref:2TM domain-containing protein n=1 Tax=Ramlibacter sp. MMS24-I3-19 TaxID=3416606 RepID=UPI003D07A1CB
MTAFATRLTDTEIEDLARRRARARIGWLTHAFVFLAVHLLLAAIALASGHAPRLFGVGTLAWGFGLAMHGVSVLVHGSGTALVDRLVARERARLLAHRDPW